jgi:hypothetical protein
MDAPHIISTVLGFALLVIPIGFMEIHFRSQETQQKINRSGNQ